MHNTVPSLSDFFSTTKAAMHGIYPFTQSWWWIPATPASTTQNIGCPSIMTPSKMGKTKNLIFYSLIVCLFVFYSYLTKTMSSCKFNRPMFPLDRVHFRGTLVLDYPMHMHNASCALLHICYRSRAQSHFR